MLCLGVQCSPQALGSQLMVLFWEVVGPLEPVAAQLEEMDH